MATQSGQERNIRVSRIIKAPRRAIYQVFLDPRALVSWLPPRGMKGCVYEFDAQEGGGYRMSLTYVDPDHSTRGNTSEHTEVVRARFLKIIPDERIVQLIEFESEDPAFEGPMTIKWTLADVPEGTEDDHLFGFWLWRFRGVWLAKDSDFVVA